MQAALSIDIPDSGILFDECCLKTTRSFPATASSSRGSEAEIAFVMKFEPPQG